MNVLVVHEIDWLKSVVYEPHYLAELLAINGHNVYVIDCRMPIFKEFCEALTCKSCIIYRVYDSAKIHLIRPPTIALPFLYRAIAFLTHRDVIESTIKEKSIDIILLFSAPTNGYHTIKAAKKLGVPVIFRSSDVIHLLQKSNWRKRITKFFEKRVYEGSNRILATTSFAAKYVQSMGARSDKVSIVPLGIDTSIFSPNNVDYSLRNTLGLQESDKIIVFVGTLYPFSGLDYILRNFYQISDCVMIIVGRGPMYDKYTQLTNDLGISSRVHFVGFQDHSRVPNYINLADVCLNSYDLLPETQQLFTSKVMEYLACQKPVISTPLNGTMEWLPEEQSGVIYCKNGEQVIESIRNLIISPERRKKLGLNGRNYVVKYFERKTIIQTILKEMENLINY